MKIKVCGMRDGENIRQLVALKPDYIGFIFYTQSKRFAGALSEEILLSFPEEIKKTGVFVNSQFTEIVDRIESYRLNAVQLHGTEDAGFCKKIKDTGIEVIKAFGMDATFDFNSLVSFKDSVDYFLFDTKTVQYGGSGQVFEWALLKKYPLEVPYFLSGGLDLDNLSKVSELNDLRFYAVDINSRFETEPGMKDISKVRKALGLVRQNSESDL